MLIKVKLSSRIGHRCICTLCLYYLQTKFFKPKLGHNGVKLLVVNYSVLLNVCVLHSLVRMKLCFCAIIMGVGIALKFVMVYIVRVPMMKLVIN